MSDDIYARYDAKVLELAAVRQSQNQAISTVRALKDGTLSLDRIELVEGGFIVKAPSQPEGVEA